MGNGSRTGKAGFAALAASLAPLFSQAEAMAEPVKLRIDNSTALNLQMPADADARGGCAWRGPAALLQAGESAAFTIAPADGRSGVAPCNLSLAAPIMAPPPGHDAARVELDLGAPTADRLTVAVRYAYKIAGAGGPWITMPVMLTELQPGADATYLLDLTPLAEWLARTVP